MTFWMWVTPLFFDEKRYEAVGVGFVVKGNPLAYIVRGNDFGAVLRGQRLGHFQRVALDGKIEIPDGDAAQHVAHRSAGQKQIDVGIRRQ